MLKIKSKLIFAGVALTLAACGGGGGAGNGSGSASTAAATSPSSATVSTSLSAAAVTQPDAVTLTVTISNSGTSAVNDGALAVPLPAGGKNTSDYTVGAPCSSTSFKYGSSGFALAGLTVPAGATCTNTFTLSPSSTGIFDFVPTGLVSVTAGTTASLVVN